MLRDSSITITITIANTTSSKSTFFAVHFKLHRISMHLTSAVSDDINNVFVVNNFVRSLGAVSDLIYLCYTPQCRRVSYRE